MGLGYHRLIIVRIKIDFSLIFDVLYVSLHNSFMPCPGFTRVSQPDYYLMPSSVIVVLDCMDFYRHTRVRLFPTISKIPNERQKCGSLITRFKTIRNHTHIPTAVLYSIYSNDTSMHSVSHITTLNKITQKLRKWTMQFKYLTELHSPTKESKCMILNQSSE